MRHVVTIAVLIIPCTVNAQIDKDYMSPELRTEVEQLKKDVADNPTNGNTLKPRA